MRELIWPYGKSVATKQIREAVDGFSSLASVVTAHVVAFKAVSRSHGFLPVNLKVRAYDSEDIIGIRDQGTKSKEEG